MIRIAITQAAFDAIAKTLPFGSVGDENATNEKGERLDLVGAERGRPPPVSCAGRARAQRRHPGGWRGGATPRSLRHSGEDWGEFYRGRR